MDAKYRFGLGFGYFVINVLTKKNLFVILTFLYFFDFKVTLFRLSAWNVSNSICFFNLSFSRIEVGRLLLSDMVLHSKRFYNIRARDTLILILFLFEGIQVLWTLGVIARQFNSILNRPFYPFVFKGLWILHPVQQTFDFSPVHSATLVKDQSTIYKTVINRMLPIDSHSSSPHHLLLRVVKGMSQVDYLVEHHSQRPNIAL